MIRVLLADSSERIIANLERRLGAEEDITVCGSVSGGDQAIQESLHLRPDVVVVDADLPGMGGLKVTEMLAQFVPATGVILMCMEGENDLYRGAMLAGAREVLQKPFKGSELVSAIHRVHEFQERKRAGAAGAAAAATNTAQNGAPRQPDESAAAGRLFTVLAGKGGVGKTVLATNLAVALAGHAQRVALVDLSLQFGDVAAMLDVQSQRTIADLAAHDAVADHEVVQDVLATSASGLHVLPAPTSPELADYVTTQHLRALFDELRRTHGLVVADTTSQLGEITLEAVESSDRIVVLTDFSVTGVKNARLVMSVLGVLKVAPERIVLVANHRDAPSGSDLERAQAEAFLHESIAVEIPFEPDVVAASVSRGAPFVSASPQSGAAHAVTQLAALLVGEAMPEAPPEPPARKRGRRLLGLARQ